MEGFLILMENKSIKSQEELNIKWTILCYYSSNESSNSAWIHKLKTVIYIILTDEEYSNTSIE